MSCSINIKLTYLSIILLFIIYITYTKSFKNDIPVCDDYTLNVYLYIFLRLVLMLLLALFIIKRNYPITKSKSLLFLIISILSGIMLFITSPDNIVINHILLLSFVISLAVFLYAVYKYYLIQYKKVVISVIYVGLLILLMCILGLYIYPDLIYFNLVNSLFITLFITITLFSINNNEKIIIKLLASLFLIFSILLMLYNTTKIRINALSCTLPDYPKESIKIFLW